MHAVFPIIAVTAATFGGMAGWFLRGRFRLTILICTITPILAHAAFLCLQSGKGFVKDEFADFFFHILLPFLVLTVPCIIGGAMMALAYHMKHAKRREGNQSPTPEHPVSASGLIQPWKRR